MLFNSSELSLEQKIVHEPRYRNIKRSTVLDCIFDVIEKSKGTDFILNHNICLLNDGNIWMYSD